MGAYEYSCAINAIAGIFATKGVFNDLALAKTDQVGSLIL